VGEREAASGERDLPLAASWVAELLGLWVESWLGMQWRMMVRNAVSSLDILRTISIIDRYHV
jgi:hypothetical protein